MARDNPTVRMQSLGKPLVLRRVEGRSIVHRIAQPTVEREDGMFNECIAPTAHSQGKLQRAAMDLDRAF